MTDRPIRTLVAFGTRPEALKMYPVIRALERDDRFDLRVVATGQHREMLDQVLERLEIRPHVDLDLMTHDHTLNALATRVVERMDRVYADLEPDHVLVQGDTTTAACAALAAFHRGIHVSHVEAGLRSFDRRHPFPEESNRRIIGAVADLHFAPTALAARHLRREGIPREDILVTGNTVVDCLLSILRDSPELLAPGEEERRLRRPGGFVLITLHRRESWIAGGRGAGTLLEEILRALRDVAARRDDVDFIYAVHRNPNVRNRAFEMLGASPNIHLTDPIPYFPFLGLMIRSRAVLTDSGGIQEEAPTFGIPVLVARKVTERPEGVRTGTNRMVGTEYRTVREALERVLEVPKRPLDGIPYENPYGDGGAAERIRQGLLSVRGKAPRPEAFRFRAADPAAPAPKRTRRLE